MLMQPKEVHMDHKQTISFTMAQKSAISIAAKRAGLSFSAYVRSASIAKAAEAGIEVQQPQAD